MSTILFGSPIYSDVSTLFAPTLTGGSWSSTLPLTNLQDRRLAKVARSASAALSSTQFTVNLGTTRRVRLVAIPKHTISSVGTVRARGYAGAFITPENDFSGFASVGTPTRSAAAFTDSVGVPMDLIGDDSAVALEGFTKVYTFSGNAAKVVGIRIKQGTSTSVALRIRDTSAGADRLLAVVTWSGGVPSVAMTTGTLLASTLVATGVYRLTFTTTAVTAANTNQWEVYPAANAALAVGGTGDVYAADVEAFDSTTDLLNFDCGVVTPYPSGQTAEDVQGLNIPVVLIPSATPSDTRRVRIEIADTTNTAGYVDLGRLIVAGGFQPTVNIQYGAGLGLTTATERLETDGGAALFNQKVVRRILVGTLDDMPEAEAFASWWRMMKTLGTAGQLFVVMDPADTYASGGLMHERSFLAVFGELSPMEQATMQRYRNPFKLIEEL